MIGQQAVFFPAQGDEATGQLIQRSGTVLQGEGGQPDVAQAQVDKEQQLLFFLGGGGCTQANATELFGGELTVHVSKRIRCLRSSKHWRCLKENCFVIFTRKDFPSS